MFPSILSTLLLINEWPSLKGTTQRKEMRVAFFHFSFTDRPAMKWSPIPQLNCKQNSCPSISPPSHSTHSCPFANFLDAGTGELKPVWIIQRITDYEGIQLPVFLNFAIVGSHQLPLLLSSIRTQIDFRLAGWSFATYMTMAGVGGLCL